MRFMVTMNLIVSAINLTGASGLQQSEFLGPGFYVGLPRSSGVMGIPVILRSVKALGACPGD